MGLVLWYIKKYVLCLNNREVAQRLGEVHTTIGNYELGKTKVTINYLEEFCEVFKINISQVFKLYLLCRVSGVNTSNDDLKDMLSEPRLAFLNIINQIVDTL